MDRLFANTVWISSSVPTTIASIWKNTSRWKVTFKYRFDFSGCFLRKVPPFITNVYVSSLRFSDTAVLLLTDHFGTF